MTTPIGNNRETAFDEYLQASGIPISGLTNTNGTVEGLVINFLPEATQTQVDFAEAAKLTFEWRKLRAVTQSAVETAFSSLGASVQNQILRKLVMYFARQNPAQVQAMLDAAGITLPVQEVDPT